MTPSVYYIMPGWPLRYRDTARKFVASYQRYSAGAKHDLICLVSGDVTPDIKAIFAPITVQFTERTNTGWDIGGFLEASKTCKSDMMFCLGTNTIFKSDNWLKRFTDTWQLHGPGLYGALTSLEYGYAHVITTGFACQPSLLATYPYSVTTYADRGEFEHGPDNFTAHCRRSGAPIKLVTWSGCYDEKDRLKPQNTSNRVNQSDCILTYTQTDIYDNATPERKRTLARQVSGL
jgi:hypothetical protein